MTASRANSRPFAECIVDKRTPIGSASSMLDQAMSRRVSSAWIGSSSLPVRATTPTADGLTSAASHASRTAATCSASSAGVVKRSIVGRWSVERRPVPDLRLQLAVEVVDRLAAENALRDGED